MYIFKPKRKNSNGLLLSSGMLALALLILAAGILLREKIFFLQYTSLIPFSVSVLVLSRYVFTDFEYILDGETFSVREIQRSRSFVSVRIAVSEIFEIAEANKGKLPKGFKKQAKCFDCRKNFLTKDFVALKITSAQYLDDGKPIVILLEPDKKMLHMLKD